jgi:hypothetical protein
MIIDAAGSWAIPAHRNASPLRSVFFHGPFLVQYSQIRQTGVQHCIG